MLNSASTETVFALRNFKRVVVSGRPIVWWIGAGASRWAGFESWKDLARRMRSHFHKNQPNFDNTAGKNRISTEDYPGLFELCKQANPQEYRRFLVDAFRPKSRSAAYDRFISKLIEIHPSFVITTNIDEELERSISNPALIQNTDLSRIEEELQHRRSFIAKLHGSISSIESAVFASSEYALLLSDNAYLEALKNIFNNSSVVFLGYGVRDDYVLKLIRQNERGRQLFGAGPHFVVKASGQDIPIGLQPIEYQVGPNGDHSAAIGVIEVYLQGSRSSSSTVLDQPKSAFQESRNQTAYYVSDFMPPGTWQTSQTVVASRSEEPIEIEVKTGLGYADDEIPFRTSTALHDLLVGLVCFDFVYLPPSSLHQVFSSIGEDRVRTLITNGALQFIDTSTDLAGVFGKGEPLGSLADIAVHASESVGLRTAREKIRRVLSAVPGKEAEAEQLLEVIEKRVVVYSAGNTSIASLTRDALLMPRVPELLGISEALLPSQLPQWLVFPYLRLGHLVQTAAICKELKIQAAKLPFGGEALTNAAFGSNVSPTTADQVASYVLSGRHNSDIGAYVAQTPSVIDNVIRFRDTSGSESLRREIQAALMSDAAGGFTASINAGLAQTVPMNVLEKARDGLSILFTESSKLTTTPAVWTNEWQSDAVTRFWRDKSRRILLDLCIERKIRKQDPCICGSGDALGECCLRPLHT
jgi:hypothetical protein